MVKEGIVLGHKISKNGIEVDKAKVDMIAKLPHPTTVKGVRIYQKSQENSQNEQARTREPEEYKAEARKAKPQSKSAKKNQS
ncbi:hypothetical protein Tco_1379592 [Tanacetum coccineum]